MISHVDHHELHKLELLWIGETRCCPGTHRDGEKALLFNSFSYGNQIKSQHSKKSPVKTEHGKCSLGPSAQHRARSSSVLEDRD